MWNYETILHDILLGCFIALILKIYWITNQADTCHLIWSLRESCGLLGLFGWSISLWDESLGRCFVLLGKLFCIGIMIPGTEITLCRVTFSFLYWPTFYHSRHDMWTWHCCYNLSAIIKAKLNSPDIPYVWYRPSRTDNPNESYQCQYIEGIWVVDRYGNGQQLAYQNGKQLM